jgi:hypothetical protein
MKFLKLTLLIVLFLIKLAAFLQAHEACWTIDGVNCSGPWVAMPAMPAQVPQVQPLIVTTAFDHNFRTGDVVRFDGLHDVPVREIAKVTVIDSRHISAERVACVAVEIVGEWYYRCTTVPDKNAEQLFWVNPDTIPADVRYLGHRVNDGLLYCYARFPGECGPSDPEPAVWWPGIPGSLASAFGFWARRTIFGPPERFICVVRPRG